MTAKEYLQNKLNLENNSTKQVVFLIGEVVGEGHDKRIMYRTSPVRCYWEWLRFLEKAAFPEKNILNFHILNNHSVQPSWLSGACYDNAIKDGYYVSLLVMSSEELSKYYNEEQWKQTVKYIEDKINKEFENKKLGRVGMPYGK